MTEQIVLETSDDAARLATVEGWVDRFGRYHGADERAARWAGCTHILCRDCGCATTKGRLVCDPCYRKRRDAMYQALPVVEWDGETPLCTWDSDDYFFSAEEVEEYVYDHGIDPADLQLVVCKPLRLSTIDVDHWADDMPEDGELPPEVEAALDVLNRAIEDVGPVGWHAGAQRVVWVGAQEPPR